MCHHCVTALLKKQHPDYAFHAMLWKLFVLYFLKGVLDLPCSSLQKKLCFMTEPAQDDRRAWVSWVVPTRTPKVLDAFEVHSNPRSWIFLYTMWGTSVAYPPLYRAPKHPLEGGKCPGGEREEATGSVPGGIWTRLLPWCQWAGTSLPGIARRRAGSWYFGLVTTASSSHEESGEQKPAHKFSQLSASHCSCNCSFLEQLLLMAGHQHFLSLSPQCLSQSIISVNSPRATDTETSHDLPCQLWEEASAFALFQSITAKTATEEEHREIKGRNSFPSMLFWKLTLQNPPNQPPKHPQHNKICLWTP